MSKRKKKGYRKFSRESRKIRPQEMGMLFSGISKHISITTNGIRISVSVGFPKALKLWIKSNGTKIGYNTLGQMVYEIDILPYAIKKLYGNKRRPIFISRY